MTISNILILLSINFNTHIFGHNRKITKNFSGIINNNVHNTLDKKSYYFFNTYYIYLFSFIYLYLMS